MTVTNLPILSLLVWTPIIGGVLALIAGDRHEQTVKYFSLGVSVITFVFSVLLYLDFDNAGSGMQFVEKMMWIGAFDIQYFLGVDGIALPLIVFQ
ncbi:MAG: hypothetical protein AAF419_04080 [Pseudomonadota bacterium]